MNLIKYATEADGPGLAKVNVQSFQSRRLLEELFPEASLTRMQEYKIIVGMKHLANPNMHVLKIHDPVSGDLATYSRWQFPASFGPSLVTLSEKAALLAKDPIPHAPRPMNEGVFNAFKKLLEDGRKRYTTDNDIILDLLATLPEYQGRGFGSAILKWGMEKADASQSRIFLEGTPEGVPIYLKHGWKIVEEVIMDYTPFGSVGQESFFLMMRDPIPQ
ncbi:Acyl-CoA N-acyltransferase [Penicillium samsonianum]|uniref:Acyl-CoA N-acyltransferase n=1 Tax=Penicillium samsonianum TaxID=1882272 RepID=UPI0025469D8E|nr:Acyl-CoA N-acyltransferase [Penicillium samsonianum]KAJ6150635.1 Acyl-CoA N-acyltransferase [Penicillium samsonianum]